MQTVYKCLLQVRPAMTTTTYCINEGQLCNNVLRLRQVTAAAAVPLKHFNKIYVKYELPTTYYVQG